MLNKLRHINLPYVLLAIVCAILCWLYVDVTVEPDTRVTIRNIPVTFVGEEALQEEGLMITDGQDATVSLTLVGTRAVVSQLKRTNITITVDLTTQVTEAGTQSLNYTVSYPNTINLSSVKIRSRSVSSVEVTVVQMGNKTVSVAGSFTGSVAEGYLYDSNAFSFDVTEITVTGEEPQVEQVDHAVATLTEQNLSETWIGTLALTLVDADGNEVDQEGLTLSQSEVQATFPVSLVKEISLAVTIVEGGGATEDDVTCTISPETLKVSGTQEALDGLDTFSVGTIDLSQVVTSERQSFSIDLPDGITNVSGTTVATVTLSIDSSLTTTKVTTTNIQLVNQAEDVTATLVTESLDVRIRGDKDTMSLLVEDDVVVEVDMSDVSSEVTGTVTLPATVKVTGMSDVGAVGDYEVTVELG